VSLRYDVARLCAATGTTPRELRRYERLGLLVPRRRRWPPWGPRVEYTEDQLDVLRWLLKTVPDPDTN